MNYSKKQAVSTVIKCGKEYKENLANTRLLVIYRDRILNEIKHIEVVFRPSNYQHLTGLLMIDDSGIHKGNSSVEFYHK